MKKYWVALSSEGVCESIVLTVGVMHLYAVTRQKPAQLKLACIQYLFSALWRAHRGTQRKLPYPVAPIQRALDMKRRPTESGILGHIRRCNVAQSSLCNVGLQDKLTAL
jgi:hypothetical protein